MIRLKNFSIGFGSRLLLEGVDTTFVQGQLTALIGRNGSGKSTLLRALSGLNRAYSGDIFFGERRARDLRPQESARLLSFVSTGHTRIPNLRCADVVAMGRAPYTNWIGRMQDVDCEAVAGALRAVGMERYARRTMDTMSDGECQRIMIARALAQDTPVILLDEPTSFLDLPNRYELVTLLRTLAHEQHKCVLFSTHELDVALRLCDSIALVDHTTLRHLPVAEMVAGGHIQRLFHLPDYASEPIIRPGQ